MRLFELTQIDEVTAAQDRALEARDWKNPREIMRWLEDRGYQKKGSGSFAVAYVHPQYRRIVKISKRQDVCWLRFAYWTLKMTSNPSVPYIDWVRTYGEDDKFFVAVVEKLAPFNRNAIMETADVAGLAYLLIHEPWFESDMTILGRLVKEGIIDKSDRDAVYNGDRNEKATSKVRKWLKSAKSGKRFINTLQSAKKFAKGGCSYDLHDGNLMYRPKDRRIVIIDPLADLSDIGFSF
jgi:hypothetical protein